MTLTRIPQGTYRMFGNPRQVPVYNMNELSDLIEFNNGINNCYLSVCFFKEGSIHPLFYPIDLDGSDAKDDAKKILKFLRKIEMNYYFIFSGSKGYHFQIPLSGKHSKMDFMNMSQYLRKELKLKSLDTRVSTDIRTLLRIPYTINMKSGKLCYIIEEVNDGIELIIPYITGKWEDEDMDFSFETNIGSDLINSFPCLERYISIQEPPNVIRFGYVVMLGKMGYNPEQIFNILEAYNWKDWNPSYTRYQIQHALSKNYNLTCSMFTDYCLGVDCKYNVKSRRKK